MRNSNHTTLAAVLIVLALFANYSIYSKIITDKLPKAEYTEPQNTELTAAQKAELEKKQREEDILNNYTNLTATGNDTKCGELILVNKQHLFDFDARATLFETELPESIYQKKTDNYYVKNVNISLNQSAIEALNKLLDDFAAETGHKDIIIVDAFRSYETQQVVLDAKIAQYGEEQGRLIATEPGASEHHSGYAIDLSLYINSQQLDYDGTGDYEWITQNCAKYGFVIRYPEGKTNITEIDYEPWHLRYVGIPHAKYMTENNLCLEEYIEKLALYPIDSERLKITDYDGNNYEVYSVGVPSDGSEIKVPKNKPYTLSGDNAGHIIVTVSENAQPVQDNTQAVQNSETPSQSEDNAQSSDNTKNVTAG